MVETLAPRDRPYRPEPSGTAFKTFVVIIVIAAILYLGREIFVPLALATLLSFALAPPMLWLRRYVGRLSAVIVVVTLAFVSILAFGTIMTSQLASLAANLPSYQTNIAGKLHSLLDIEASSPIIRRAAATLKDLQSEIEKSIEANKRPAAPAVSGSTSSDQPVPVVIRQAEPGLIQVVQSVIGPLLAPLATTGIVVLIVIFMLLEREHLRDRLIRLVGAHDLERTTEALDDAARRVSRYLLMQLVVNAIYGLPIGIGLWLIGVPNAVLWGLLAVLLRFIPYIGPWIAALGPLALSIAVDPGWSLLVWTGGLFIAMEFVIGNVLEPWIYGSSTGLSSIAIIVAAVFWAWLWGLTGLLLSVPLTVCLVVLGRHVPRLEFLDVLLGNEPVLTPAQRFYQRMLAADPDQATEQVEACLKEQPLGTCYDKVVMPGLALAQEDRDRGALERERLDVVVESAEAVLENLEDTVPATEPVVAEPQDGAITNASRPVGGILCVAGRRDLDRAAASYLADLLRRAALPAHVVRAEAAGHLPDGLDTAAVRVVCLSYMNANAIVHARYVVRRLRRRLPRAVIVAGFWSLPPEQAKAREPLTTTGADAVVTSLQQAVAEIHRVLGTARESDVKPTAPDAQPRAAQGLQPAH
jgi:predicted PurR-regulated permease PerM